jgi:hypothetical protein
MMNSADFFASCKSPVDLMRAVGVEPISPAIETFLDASCAAPPTKAQRVLLSKMSAQSWPKIAPKRVVLCAGRGSTKTTAAAWLSAFHLLCVDHDAHALPNSRIHNACFAPSKRQAAEAVRIERTVLDALAPLGVTYDITDGRGDGVELVITSPQTRCERISGIWSLADTTMRGFAFPFFRFTEAGHAKAGPDYKVTDEAVVQSIVPRLAQFPRAQAVFESTPGAPQGVFFDLVTSPPPQTLLVRQSTFFFNPRITEAEARSWVTDGREFRQEILAEIFGFTGEGFLDSTACEQCLE